MIRIGIVGATGYGGRELVRLLHQHPGVELAAVTSTTSVGAPLSDALPGFRQVTDLAFDAFDAEALAAKCDAVFVGVPSTESTEMVQALRQAGVRVIDIGPDFRLKDMEAFKTYYKSAHAAPELAAEAVYGWPAFYREAIRTAGLVAAPGCYPLTAIVPLRPLVAAAPPSVPIVVDAISGVSGAGRATKDYFHFPEMNENAWAYKVALHQHTPEIEQEIGGQALVQFTPHVGPYTRGILTTITYRTETAPDFEAVYGLYEQEPFIRVLGENILPELRNVRATNFCDFGWVQDGRTGNTVLVSAADNLMAGTAGTAVQCMNLMFGLEETAGLHCGGMSV